MRDECVISALVLRLQFDTRSLSIQQKVWLMPMVATVRNSYFYHNILNLKRTKEMMAKTIMHGKDVSPTVRHSFVFPLHDGANLSRSIRDEASWECH